jgi:hypothetical protein
MKTIAIAASVMLLSACVSITEEQKEEREYQDVEQRAAYFAYKRQCRSNGGIVVINGSHGRLTTSGIPKPGDYRCQKSLAFL